MWHELEEIRNGYKILVRKPERRLSVRPGVDGRIILKCILQKQGVRL
jgi:hypothetical protein